jgi:hypothetical protein
MRIVVLVSLLMSLTATQVFTEKCFAASETFSAPGTQGTTNSGADRSSQQPATLVGNGEKKDADFIQNIVRMLINAATSSSDKRSKEPVDLKDKDNRPPAHTIRVPLLEGKPLKNAELILARLGLRAEPITPAESDRAPDTVIKQSPKQNALVQSGSSVALVIARPIMVNVPNVTGRRLAEARKLIANAGLVTVTSQREVESDETRVKSQKPEANQSVVKGSRVVLQLTQAPANLPAPESRAAPESPVTTNHERTVPATQPQTSQNDLPLTEIIAGSAAALLLGGALLFHRVAKNKPGIGKGKPVVSIHETIDYGSQQVQIDNTSHKLPAISIEIRHDPGIQQIGQP